MLVLAPRTSHKAFTTWMRDSLVKQGLGPAPAETLLVEVGAAVPWPRAEVGLLRSVLGSLEQKGAKLVLGNLATLDCLVARIQMSMDKVSTLPMKMKYI